jgi:hypothetical protein
MCWSASVSLNTYVFSTFATVFAYSNQTISLVNLLFLQSFMLMQLVEYFVWSNTTLVSNATLSKVAFLLILLQPLLGLITLQHKAKIPLLIGYILFIFVTVTVIKPWSRINFQMSPGPNGHLAWYWLDFGLPVLCIWLGFLLAHYALAQQWIMLMIVFIFAATSYILFYKTKTWGSMWCWIANIIAFLLVIGVFKKDICISKN